MSETIKEYYQWIQRDMKKAILMKNDAQQKLELVRLQRLLGKLEKQLSESIINNQYAQAATFLSLKDEIYEQLGKWYARFAEEQDLNGNVEASSMYWLSAIGLHKDPQYLIKYAQLLMKHTGLQPHKKIEENMEYVNPYNIHELIPTLKMIQVCLKDAVKVVGHQEDTRYILAFIDLVEKEIEQRPDLQEALNQEELEISIESALNELNKLIGMTTVKAKVKEISNWIMFSKMRQEQGLKTENLSYHMVFSGNPGTGKTTVARIIAQIYKALGVLKKGHLVEVGRSDLVAEYVGQTAVKTMKQIKAAENGVLFVDEAYALTRSGSNDFGIEAIDTLVKAMEDKRDKLVVILAGYPKEMDRFIQSNPGLYSRFKYHIEFPDYTSQELMQILRAMLHEKQYRMDEQASQIAERLIKRVMIKKPTEHGNGRLVRNLLEDAILKKATHAINQKDLETAIQLDLIDETVMKLVEIERTSY